ncbi:unnamed protein product, partial [Iphiclides podalirius]
MNNLKSGPRGVRIARVVVVLLVVSIVRAETKGLSEERRDKSIEEEMFSREALDVTDATEFTAKNPRQALKNDLMYLFDKELRFVVALLPSETLEEKYERSTPPHPHG